MNLHMQRFTRTLMDVILPLPNLQAGVPTSRKPLFESESIRATGDVAKPAWQAVLATKADQWFLKGQQ